MKPSDILNGSRPASQGGMHLGHTPTFWPGHATIMIRVPFCHPDPSNLYFHAVLSFISPFKYVFLNVKYFILSGTRLSLKLFFHPKLSQKVQRSLGGNGRNL